MIGPTKERITCNDGERARLEIRRRLAYVRVARQLMPIQIPLHDAAHIQLPVVPEERLLEFSVQGEVFRSLVQPYHCHGAQARDEGGAFRGSSDLSVRLCDLKCISRDGAKRRTHVASRVRKPL